ncbi:DinB family protein [Paenibacillus favisporus]
MQFNQWYWWQLMTHVMTHEFHHKGQIMTMGRECSGIHRRMRM